MEPKKIKIHPSVINELMQFGFEPNRAYDTRLQNRKTSEKYPIVYVQKPNRDTKNPNTSSFVALAEGEYIIEEFSENGQ